MNKELFNIMIKFNRMLETNCNYKNARLSNNHQNFTKTNTLYFDIEFNVLNLKRQNYTIRLIEGHKVIEVYKNGYYFKGVTTYLELLRVYKEAYKQAYK